MRSFASLINKIDTFYSLAVSVGDRKINDRTAYVYSVNEICLLDGLSNTKAMAKFDKINPLVLCDMDGLPSRRRPYIGPAYQIRLLSADTPLDALLMISIIWQEFGPIVPDKQLSTSANLFIHRYFLQNKENQDLIKTLQISEDIEANGIKSEKCIYFPNPNFAGLARQVKVLWNFNERELPDLEEKSMNHFYSKWDGSDVLRDT
jgi:hypothetical protein